MTPTLQEETAPDSAVGFGFAEVAFMLKMFGTASATKSAEVLRLEAEVDTDRLCVAGASSLLGRGFATIGEDLELEGPAVAVAYALARAQRWTEISLITPEFTDTVVHVESDNVSVLLQPRTLESWFVFAQDPAFPGAEAELAIIKEHVSNHPGGTAFIRVRTLAGDEHLLIRPDADGWATGKILDPSQDVVETTGLDNLGLLGRVLAARGEAA
ncbi:hypothetical protein J7I84_12655 [Arthrobacter sp. ISL-85]|uniref:hypothetical protein n=1 Tax=Arthrobacter sp. ISL-85 TaxID=2819115 RepID=UPI001BE568E1|nr:hypothetical protein [Arthrobacter sp. ISL-85]MBT2567331.1 hypothetical protein [Arthrobacter sp. ISL-85]